MLLHAGASTTIAIAGGLHAAFWFSVLAGLATLVAIVFGLRHAATAELPLRHYLAFGKLHHRAAVRS